MRKYLGVLAGVAVLGAMTWAQAPAQTPAPTTEQAPAQAPAAAAQQAPAPAPAPDVVDIPAKTPSGKLALPPQTYPRFEWFLGGSYAKAGFFNAGYWAGLPGWDVSLGVNATRSFGIVLEGGQFFGTSKIPRGTPAPFQPCPDFCPAGSGTTFNVATREYNFLFGLQFARRKYERWTPIGELLYGHQGTRGVATGDNATETVVGTGRAIVAGGGVDYKISPRFALRFKADYFQTGTNFLDPNSSSHIKKKQDNFRFSMGIVIHNVHKKKRKLEDESQVGP